MFRGSFGVYFDLCYVVLLSGWFGFLMVVELILLVRACLEVTLGLMLYKAGLRL